MDTAVQTTMRVIGGKWKSAALLQLRAGPTRFNALKRRLPGVTQRMLAQQLRELETDGVVSRKVMEIVPPHVEYALTSKGATLIPILNWLAEWGEANGAPVPEQRPAEDIPVPQQWRFEPTDLQTGTLAHGPAAALGGTRLVFGAASLTEADG
jgi:DNA-binding HxlR family transcriptional regulator